MTAKDKQRTGKITPEIFAKVILEHLGARNTDVLIGPRHGVDVGVVRVAPGVAMALTADPVFVVPPTGGSARPGSPCTSLPPTPRPAGSPSGI